MTGAGDAASILDALFSDLQIVMVPLCVLSSAICGAGLIASPDPGSRRRHRTALLVVVGAFALFELSPALVRMILSLAEAFA